MSDKPNIGTMIDKYIHEQINNGNYEKIAVEEARKKHQLHFVGYNFVVSSTSSSTESGLSLNKVTQPAPGDIPSLRGILVH